MKKSNDLAEIEAYWRLGLLPSREIPVVAAGLLSTGVQSDVLVELAACDADKIGEVEQLFQQVLTESGYGSMSPIEALRVYARTISRAILCGEVTPFEGASSIWRATIVVNNPDFHELDTFVYAASEMDDRIVDKALFEDAITVEAKRWAGQSQP
jgi:hypothetical protein